jgi:glucose dehydrogenase
VPERRRGRTPSDYGDSSVRLPFEIRISRVLLVTIVLAALLGVASLIGGVVWLSAGGSIVSGLLLLVGGALFALVSRTGLMRVPMTITIDDRGITWKGVAWWEHRVDFAELSRVGVASNGGRTAVIAIPAKGMDTRRPAPPAYDRQGGVFTLLVLSTPGSKSPYSQTAADVAAAVRKGAGSRWQGDLA